MAKGISFLLKQEVEPTAVEDKWNFWVFNIGFYSEAAKIDISFRESVCQPDHTRL